MTTWHAIILLAAGVAVLAVTVLVRECQHARERRGWKKELADEQHARMVAIEFAVHMGRRFIRHADEWAEYFRDGGQ